MIYPNISLKEWLKLFPGLAVQDITCSCGKSGKTTRPAISKDYVGLAAPPCICGDEAPGLVVKGRNKKIQAEMNRFL